MKYRLKNWKKKMLPIFCSALSFFSSGVKNSNASFLGEANSLLELLIRLGTLISTSSRQTNRWKENFKSRVCSWNPNLCPELFYEGTPDNENSKSFHNFDWAMNFVQGRTAQKEDLREIGKLYAMSMNEPDWGVSNYAVLFNGPSGTGKSYMCDLFSRLFVSDGFDEYGPTMNIPTSILRVSSMDVDRNQKTSAWRQLLGDHSEDKGMTILSPFRKYLEDNPRGGIIVLEEVDKWWSNDLQEGLRSLIDDGRVSINGEYINVRNYLILMTSNMCSQSLHGEERPKATKDEIELGLTSPSTSRSFMNRLFTLDYGIMSREELVDIFIQDLDIWNTRNADKNISVELSDDAKDYVGNLLFNSKQGARASKTLFKTILPKLYHASKYAEVHPDEFEKLVKFELVLNTEQNNLVLKKKSDNTESATNSNDRKTNITDGKEKERSAILVKDNVALSDSKSIEATIEPVVKKLNEEFNEKDKNYGEMPGDRSDKIKNSKITLDNLVKKNFSEDNYVSKDSKSSNLEKINKIKNSKKSLDSQLKEELNKKNENSDANQTSSNESTTDDEITGFDKIANLENAIKTTDPVKKIFAEDDDILKT